MNCTEFELAVQARLDARQHQLTPELRAHADVCSDCHALWSEQLALLALTKAWSPPAAPAGLIDAVLAELTSPSATSSAAPRLSRQSLGNVLGTVCSLVAMVLLAVTLVRLVPPDPQPPVAVVENSVEPPQATLVSQTLSGLWQGMHVEYAELSVETRRVMQDWGDLPDSAGLLPDLPRTETPATDQPPAWMRLDRPVSERVGQAFDFLWDALPRTPPQSS